MTTPVIQTRYRCDWCRKSFASRSYAMKHERNCYKNPASHACPSCMHWTIWQSCALGVAPTFTGNDGEKVAGWRRECPEWLTKGQGA